MYFLEVPDTTEIAVHLEKSSGNRLCTAWFCREAAI